MVLLIPDRHRSSRRRFFIYNNRSGNLVNVNKIIGTKINYTKKRAVSLENGGKCVNTKT